MAVSKFYPTPFGPTSGVKGQIFKFRNKAIVDIFAEILHAGRAAIDMKHIKRWGTQGVGPRPKLNFQNTTMLHIKLKLATLAAIWYQYFAHRHTLDPGGGVNRSTIYFSESSHVAYQIKEN